jgi:putative transposase
MKMKAWQIEKKNISVFDLVGDLPLLKKQSETAWLSDVPAQSLQKSLANLDKAYLNFFRTKRGFPKFKSKHDLVQSVQYPQGINKTDWKSGKVNLPKIGRILVVLDRQFSGAVKTCTVSKTSTGKYFISILVDDEVTPLPLLPIEESSTVGIDLGLTHFAIFSSGKKIDNPRFLKQSLKKLASAQRKLSKKQKGSKRRNKQRLVIAKLHEKVTNQRKDFLHKVSTRIIRENQTVALETLNVKGMVQNRKLARSISDVSWSEFVSMLVYKAEWSGKNVLRIGMFEPSSRLCTCGKVNSKLSLADRMWTCGACGTTHDRDILAANNIKRMALHPQSLIHQPDFDTVGHTGI